jgi:hypothetical protein
MSPGPTMVDGNAPTDHPLHLTPAPPQLGLSPFALPPQRQLGHVLVLVLFARKSRFQHRLKHTD